MSPISKDVQADLILPDLKVSTSKQALQAMVAEVVFRTDNISAEMLLNLLLKKEEQFSSGIGGGVAIPHMQLSGLREPLMVLARLPNSIDFNAIDHQNVDLVFLLLSPAEDGPLHLRRLSRISRVLKNEELCNQLRAAKTAHEMRALLGTPETWLIAA